MYTKELTTVSILSGTSVMDWCIFIINFIIIISVMLTRYKNKLWMETPRLHSVEDELWTYPLFEIARLLIYRPRNFWAIAAHFQIFSPNTSGQSWLLCAHSSCAVRCVYCIVHVSQVVCCYMHLLSLCTFPPTIITHESSSSVWA